MSSGLRLSISLLCLLMVSSLSEVEAVQLKRTGPERTSAFYSQADQHGWSVDVVGKIMSFSSLDYADGDNLSGKARVKSAVTVRLFQQQGIREGDELFVIDSKNLITARINVKRVFQSKSFGWMMIGNGNFRNCRENDRVVQRKASGVSDYANIHRVRGDYFRNTGDNGKAIFEYKNAIKLDPGCPEARMGLGLLYLQDNMLQFAFNELLLAYGRLSHVYDREDRFLILGGLAQIRFREYFELDLPESRLVKFRDEGIKYCEEALKYYPQSAEINYYLGRFYYQPSTVPEKDDERARDYFMKVVQFDPGHAGANTALAELYLKYRNRDKALYYANRILEYDSSNGRAKQLIKYIEEYNR